MDFMILLIKMEKIGKIKLQILQEIEVKVKMIIIRGKAGLAMIIHLQRKRIHMILISVEAMKEVTKD